MIKGCSQLVDSLQKLGLKGVGLVETMLKWIKLAITVYEFHKSPLNKTLHNFDH